MNPSYSQNAAGQFNFNGDSSKANEATGYFPTLQAAQQSWAQKYGGTVGASGPNTTPPPAQNLAQGLQPFYNPAPPMVQPSFFSGAQIAPNAQSTAQNMQAAQSNAQTGISPELYGSLGADSTIQQLMKAFAPQAQSAQMNLNDSLAAAGLSGGPAIAQTNQLQGTLASSLGNTLAGAIQNSQSNQLGAGEFGASQSLQQALQNAGFQQGANQYNAGTQTQNNQFNAGNQNALNAQQAGMQQQAGMANAGAANQSTEFNAQNMLATQFGNTSTANQFEQYLAGMMQNAYQNNQNNFTNLNSAGLGAQQSINGQAANNFQIPSGAGGAVGGFAQQIGSIYGNRPPANVAPAPAPQQPVATPNTGQNFVNP